MFGVSAKRRRWVLLNAIWHNPSEARKTTATTLGLFPLTSPKSLSDPEHAVPTAVVASVASDANADLMILFPNDERQ